MASGIFKSISAYKGQLIGGTLVEAMRYPSRHCSDTKFRNVKQNYSDFHSEYNLNNPDTDSDLSLETLTRGKLIPMNANENGKIRKIVWSVDRICNENAIA